MVVVLFIASVFYAKAYEEKNAATAEEDEHERVEL
jgi:hypothetical protein